MVVIQLNKPLYSGSSYNPFPNYDDDQTIFAKALRVLVDLQEESMFHEFLDQNAINKIMVTTASKPSLVSNENKWNLEVSVSKKLVKELLDAKASDRNLYERTFN
jgi:hypothetical protein